MLSNELNEDFKKDSEIKGNDDDSEDLEEDFTSKEIKSEENVIEDDSDEDEGDSGDEKDDFLTTLLKPLTLTEKSDLYVVSVDGVPKFYVKDQETAHKKMWEVASSLSSKMIDYRTNYLEISKDELHLVGSYRFFILAHDKTIHRIKYFKIQECI